jgi:hypothetical protein
VPDGVLLLFDDGVGVERCESVLVVVTVAVSVDVMVVSEDGVGAVSVKEMTEWVSSDDMDDVDVGELLNSFVRGDAVTVGDVSLELCVVVCVKEADDEAELLADGSSVGVSKDTDCWSERLSDRVFLFRVIDTRRLLVAEFSRIVLEGLSRALAVWTSRTDAVISAVLVTVSRGEAVTMIERVFVTVSTGERRTRTSTAEQYTVSVTPTPHTHEHGAVELATDKLAQFPTKQRFDAQVLSTLYSTVVTAEAPSDTGLHGATLLYVLHSMNTRELLLLNTPRPSANTVQPLPAAAAPVSVTIFFPIDRTPLFTTPGTRRKMDEEAHDIVADDPTWSSTTDTVFESTRITLELLHCS